MKMTEADMNEQGRINSFMWPGQETAAYTFYTHLKYIDKY